MQSKYEVIGITGEGAYGVVYQCKHKETGEFVAIKKFKEVEDELVKKTMQRELKMLQLLKHDNIVEYKEAFKRKGNLFLVFEYVDKNLLELLQEQPKGLDPAVIKKLIFQLCKAIKYIHDLNIVHRDIKPENLLVDSNLKLKLCDFGFARTIKSNKEKLTDYVATRWYRSPELLLTSGYYGPEVDFWAIGCIMGELADGDPLFPGDNEFEQLKIIQKVLGKFPDYQYELFYNNPNYKNKGKLPEVTKPETLERRYMGKLSKQAISFMKALLHPDPKLRLKGDNVFSHPYFENYPDPFPITKPLELNSNLVIPSGQINSPINDTARNPISNFSTVKEGMKVEKQQDKIPDSKQDKNIDKTEKMAEKKVSQNNVAASSQNMQPIISNTTNINIINYNNYDKPPAVVSPNNESAQIIEKISNTNTINKANTNTERKPNHLSNTNGANKFLNNKSVSPNNMLLTSYNFNQNLKDNILAMYSSTSFDKNFKTFYKGDPYNFDIDMHFMNKGKGENSGQYVKNNQLNPIDEEKIKKSILYPLKKTITNFNSGDKTPPKNKKKTTTNYAPIVENKAKTNVDIIQTKLANFKITNNNNTKNPNSTRDFMLPSINNKNYSLKKLMK
jgi:cyclin-dependent kinase-like